MKIDLSRSIDRSLRKALRRGDQFRESGQLAGALIRAREQSNHWERYLLQLETLSVRREEVAATGDFIKGISAVTTSILRGASPDQIAAMQVKMERALVKADSLEELLSVAMDTSADSVYAVDELDEQKLDELENQMGAEAEADESAAYDKRIADGLTQVEKEMRKEL